MILKVHLDGAPCYEIGDEIWQDSLEDAIRSEAELIAQLRQDHRSEPSDPARAGRGLSIGSWTR